jgi:Domain of unknown function (DUF3331)
MRFDRDVDDFMKQSGIYLLGASYVTTLNIRSPRQQPAQRRSPLPKKNEARQCELAEAALISAEKSSVAGSRWVHSKSEIHAVGGFPEIGVQIVDIHLNAVDPWSATLGVLGQLSGETQLSSIVQSLGKPEPQSSTHTPSSGLTIHVLERSTATRMTLAWRDPLRCAYGDQHWFLTQARLPGVCAISGRKIRRGENVYRPQPTRPRALNSGAMIHAATLEARAQETLADKV